MSDARKLVNGYLFGGQHEAIIAHIESLERQVRQADERADEAETDLEDRERECEKLRKRGAECVYVNLRSHTSALRDTATLLEHTGDAQFTIEMLRSLATRIEQMHHEQEGSDG